MKYAASSVAIAIACLARTAAAQDAGVPSRAVEAEIAQLERDITREAAALSSGGCAVACRALASMERATERLCTLDPGPRCTEARAKVREATRRVQEACADCRGGGNEIRAAEQKPTTPAPQAAPPPAEPPAAPQSVSRRGGCAGCVVGGEDGAANAGVLAAIGVLAVIARRRRRSR